MIGVQGVVELSWMSSNPFPPDVRANPYPLYRRLRESDPVHFSSQTGIWFLSRYDDCMFVLRDPRFSAELGQDRRRRATALPRTMLNTDPPDHARLRRPTNAAFHAHALERLRPLLTAFADTLLDQAAERGEIDVLSDFATPVATKVLAELLGITADEIPWFERLSRAVSANLDPLAAPNAARRGRAAADSLREYFAQAVEERQSSFQQDLIGQLSNNLTHSGITSDELVATLVLFVIGGYEPIVHLIGNGILALLRHPDQLQRLHEDPALIIQGLDELLRYDSPIQMMARVATADVQLGSKVIRRGQDVVILLGSANHDPARFPDPDRLDLRRVLLPQYAFGAGPHMCQGADLARIAGQVAIATLVRRFPTLKLVNNRLDWLESLVPRGLKALRVRL